jgi:hypothetical protein
MVVNANNRANPQPAFFIFVFSFAKMDYRIAVLQAEALFMHSVQLPASPVIRLPGKGSYGTMRNSERRVTKGREQSN